MLIGIGTDPGFSDAPLDPSQVDLSVLGITAPGSTTVTVPISNAGEASITGQAVGSQVPLNTLSSSQINQLVAQYGGTPAQWLANLNGAANAPAPASSSLIPGISNTTLLIVASLLLFLMIALPQAGGGRRR